MFKRCYNINLNRKVCSLVHNQITKKTVHLEYFVNSVFYFIFRIDKGNLFTAAEKVSQSVTTLSLIFTVNCNRYLFSLWYLNLNVYVF